MTMDQKIDALYDLAAEKYADNTSASIFGLRDSLNQDVFLECVEGLEKLYEE